MMTNAHLERLVMSRPPPLEIKVEDPLVEVKVVRGTPRQTLREEKSSAVADPRLGLKLLGKGAGGLFTRGNFKLALSGMPTVNTSAGRYIQYLFGGGSWNWSGINSATEFSTLDVLFDEFFIHSVTLHYKPRNKYSAISTASASVDLNTVAANIYFLPHGAAQYTDNSGTFQNAAVTTQHKIVNMGENWTFVAHNPTRFDWDGAVTPSAQSGMGWALFSNASSYGGQMHMATPVLSGASAGFGVLVEGGVFGDIMGYYDVSVRSRA